jgi:hypothetical protein
MDKNEILLELRTMVKFLAKRAIESDDQSYKEGIKTSLELIVSLIEEISE